MTAAHDQFYQGKRVLVTGGLGFIGSNIVHRLSSLGARTTVIDSSVPGCGANASNLEGVPLDLLQIDLREAHRARTAIRSSDVIFNIAGEISHCRSMSEPERDLALNTIAQLRFLEVCARCRPGVRIVHASTRQVYGRPAYLPVDEDHPIQPVDYNGVHKHAAAAYHLVLGQAGKLDAIVLRLSNTYGPRMALGVSGQGFLAVFVRRALLGEDIEIWGDGSQLRDPLFVDDAVDAFLAAAAAPRLGHRTFNIGGPEVLPLRCIAETLAALYARAGVVQRPFPEEIRKIDIGSYYTDNRRAQTELGWCPTVLFREGAERTIAFYRDRVADYLRVAEPQISPIR